MKALAVSSILWCMACFAGTALAQQSIVDTFEKRSHLFEGLTLPYRLFVPADYDPAKAYPLVLALHGAGERGSDNERHIRPHRLATSWADPANQAVHPAFVVAPQVPSDARWTAERPVDESAFHPVELTTLALLDSLAREFNIDPDRVYVTGLSMGGHGTWDLIARLPHRFAAAVPMSGTADPTQAPRLLHLPLWIFHGETDTVVRPYSARAMVQALEDLGRAVVYTDCLRAPVPSIHFDCPGAMPQAALAEAVHEHADLIYTSAYNVGHGPWTVWYDHPLLAEWLFSKRRVDPDAIALGAPEQGAAWSGTEAVAWTAGDAAAGDVEVWFSPDDGANWDLLGAAALAEGRFELDTAALPDAAFARVRVLVLDADGRPFGRQTSGRFRVDNAGDAPPELFVDDEPLRFTPQVRADAVSLDVRAADPEGGTLDADVYYSIDDGAAFTLVRSFEMPTGMEPQRITIDVDGLPNAARARFRFDVSDGVHSASAVTAPFLKETPRIVNDYVQHVAGEGWGTVTLHFVDPEALTNHRYRITFDGSDPLGSAGKTYTVVDLDRGETVLSGVPLSDGVRESPLFDGMSLVVEDLAVGQPDPEKTGWVAGDSNLGVTVKGGSVLIAILRVQLLETEEAYEMTLTDAVADTSVAGFGLPARPLFFTMTRMRDGARRDVLFRDVLGDGRPGGGDVLHILEPGPDGVPAPAWEWRFSTAPGTILPEPGDTFRFVPLPKLSTADVFEFIAMQGVGLESSIAQDGAPALFGYPNPFAERMTIAFSLAEPAGVRLEVYDLLGRRVAVLYDGAASVGEHRAEWDGRDASGARIASGLHVLRLTATSGNGRSRSVERAVVRVR